MHLLNCVEPKIWKTFQLNENMFDKSTHPTFSKNDVVYSITKRSYKPQGNARKKHKFMDIEEHWS